MTTPEKALADYSYYLYLDGGKFNERMTLKKMAEKLKLGWYIAFTGWVKNRKILEKLMRDSGVAIAMYEKNKESFTYYAEPTKIKDYLSAGLLVILTDVPHNAKEIEEKECVMIIDYNKRDIVKAVIGLMGSKNKLQTYRKNSIKYVKRFDWDKIFSRSIEKII